MWLCDQCIYAVSLRVSMCIRLNMCVTHETCKACMSVCVYYTDSQKGGTLK